MEESKMKYLKFIFSSVFLLLFCAGYSQTYIQPAEVVSSGGGESSGGNYTNFGVIGETFVKYSVIGGNYNTNIGFLYVSEIPNGINEVFNSISLSIFPNPTKKDFTITMDITKAKDMELKLFDITGKVLWQESVKVKPGKFTKTVDMSQFAKGIHTLQLISDEGIINRKIVLE